MRRFTCLSIILVILALCGCSSGSGNLNPTAPADNIRIDELSYGSLPVGVSTRDTSGNPIDGFGALGIFGVHIYKDSLTGELVPLRKAGSTDVLEVVDITNFLSLAPCSDCIKIFSIEMDSDNNLVLNIGIRHPFDAGDPLKPITGRNRADLHVFNIEGQVITDGTDVVTFPGIGKSIGMSGLVNADGYSAYLDSVLDDIYPTEAEIHPYILHFDDYSQGNYDPANPMGFESVTAPPPSGNLVMAMGCDYDTKPYKFNINSDLDFILAVGCTYAVSADTKLMRFSPAYRVPQHLKKAASEVWVEITSNELSEGDAGSSADLNVIVVDRNHGVAVGEDLDEMYADSSVGEVIVEINGVTSSPVSFGSTPVSGTGHDPSDPLVFSGTVMNSALAVQGTYPGLVKVIDTYPTGANQSPLLNGKDGINRVSPVENPLAGVFDIAEFATYNVFTIDVIQSNELPLCEIDYCMTNGSTSINIGGHVMLDGSGSSDPDGTIELYEWDFDYDGVTFDIDETGVKAGFECTSAGTFVAALRVTDNSSDSTICSTQITCTGSQRAWETAVRVTNTEDNWYDIVGPTNANAVVVTSDCIVHLVYFTWKTTYPYERNILHTYYDGTTWSDPEEIYGFDNSYVLTVAIDRDSNDNIHGAFAITNHMWYFTNESGSWQILTVDNSSQDIENISYAINKDDAMMIAVEKADWDTGTQDYELAYYNNGSGWDAPINAGAICTMRSASSGVVTEPDLCVTPNGNFHMVYNSLNFPPCPSSDPSREIFHASFDGTSWTDHGAVSNMSGDCHQPRVFSDSQGNLHCVVGAYSQVYYGRWDAVSETWGTFGMVASGGSGNYQPDISIDQWDQAHIVWYRSAGAWTGIHKTFDALTDNISDILAKPENTIPGALGGDIWYTHIYSDFNGDAHVVYEDLTLGRWVNTEIGYVRYH
jgi:hypothetical protein